MRRAWSFFWLVVASCVAAVIIASLIEPYLGIIVTLFAVVVLIVVGVKLYSRLTSRRGRV